MNAAMINAALTCSPAYQAGSNKCLINAGAPRVAAPQGVQ
jgi:hypothetical protein